MDWLFVPGCEVWIPDIIQDEVTRSPGEGKDQRIEHRAELADWFQKNGYRIKQLRTRIGTQYAREMLGYEHATELWRRAGSPPELAPVRPDWRDRGDQSVWVGVNIANDALATGECVIALADDRNVRAAIEVRGRQKKSASINVMGTQVFIQWIVNDFGVDAASTAWETISKAREGKVPAVDVGGQDGPADDPVYIRIP